MENEQIKANLSDMAALSRSKTPSAALCRINELEGALHKLAYWFDTDQEVLDAMDDDERAAHIRQHKMILDALF